MLPVDVPLNELSFTVDSVYETVYWLLFDSRFCRRASRAVYFCQPTA